MPLLPMPITHKRELLTICRDKCAIEPPRAYQGKGTRPLSPMLKKARVAYIRMLLRKKVCLLSVFVPIPFQQCQEGISLRRARYISLHPPQKVPRKSRRLEEFWDWTSERR
jgi:hypothetical protein